jgi:hypothetical protein
MHNNINDGATVLNLWDKYRYHSTHCIGNASSCLDSLRQILEAKAVSPKPLALLYNLQSTSSYYYYIILKDGVEVLCLWVQYQSSSGNYTGHGSILDPSRQIMEPTAVATQPRHLPCYKLNILSLSIIGVQVLCLWAKYQYHSSIHFTGNASFQSTSLVKCIRLKDCVEVLCQVLCLVLAII